MIAHLSYVMCDECGSPAEPADDAKEARGLARRVGFVRLEDGRDLCRECNLAYVQEQRHELPDSNQKGQS